MANKDLVKYVKKTKNMGFSINDIRSKLKSSGHSAHEVEKAITETIKHIPKTDPVKLAFIFLIGIAGILSLTMVYKLAINSSNFDGFNLESKTISGAAIRNPTCQDLQEKERDWCYFNIAKNNQKKKYCNYITDSEINDFCISITSGDKIDCSKLLSQDLAQACI